MSPEAGRLWFRIAIFITIVALLMLPFQRPGTAEFVLTVTSLVVGLLFIGIIAWLVRRP